MNQTSFFLMAFHAICKFNIQKLKLIFLIVLLLYNNIFIAQNNPYKKKIEEYKVILETSKDKKELMQASLGIANEYSKWDQVENAMKYYKIAVAYADSIKQYNYRYDLRVLLAKRYAEQGDLEKTIDFLKEAYGISDKNEKYVDKEKAFQLLSEYENKFSKIKQREELEKDKTVNNRKKKRYIESLEIAIKEHETKILELEIKDIESQNKIEEKNEIIEKNIELIKAKEKEIYVLKSKISELESKISKNDTKSKNLIIYILAISILLVISVFLIRKLLKKVREFKRHKNELQYLNKVGRDLARNIQLDEEDAILELLFKEIDKKIDMENIFFVLYNNIDSNLRVFLVKENGKFIIANSRKQKGRELNLVKQDKIDHLIITGEPIIAPTFEKNKKWYDNHGYNELPPIISKSYLGVPITTDNKVFGAICCQDFSKENAFSDDEQQFITTLASFAAISLENAHLLKRMEIVTVPNIISGNGLSKDYIFTSINKQILEQIKCDRCTIFFPNKDKSRLIQYIPNEKKTTKIHFKIDEGMVGYVFQKGEAELVGNVYKHSSFVETSERKTKYRSMLLVPIKANDRTIAVICTDHNKEDWFTKSDQYFVELIARQAASAINLANGTEFLLKTANHMLSLKEEKGKIDNLFQELFLKVAVDLTNSTAGVIYLTSNKIKRVTKKQCFQSKGYKFPYPMNRTIEKTQIITILDILKDERVRPEFREQYKGMFESLIRVPIIEEEHVIGEFYLFDRIKHSKKEERFLEVLAEQVVVAINNAYTLSELDDKNLLLKNLVDAIPIPLFHMEKEDNQLIYKGCNEEYTKIIGKKKSDIIEKTVSEVNPLGRADKYIQKDNELFNNGNIQRFYDEFDSNNKTYIYQTIKKGFKNSSGENIGFIGIMNDLTKEVEEKFASDKKVLELSKEVEKLRSLGKNENADNIEKIIKDYIKPEDFINDLIQKVESGFLFYNGLERILNIAELFDKNICSRGIDVQDVYRAYKREISNKSLSKPEIEKINSGLINSLTSTLNKYKHEESINSQLLSSLFDLFKSKINETRGSIKEIRTYKNNNLTKSKMNAKINIFISYSSIDRELLEVIKEKLDLHLRTVQNKYDDIWTDKEISVGNDWNEVIQDALSISGVGILLVSPNFLGSKYAMGEEFEAMLTKRKNEGYLIIPILLRECNFFNEEKLSSMQFFKTYQSDYDVSNILKRNKLMPFDELISMSDPTGKLVNRYFQKLSTEIDKAVNKKNRANFSDRQ
jgi:GAF domain-containing protein